MSRCYLKLFVLILLYNITYNFVQAQENYAGIEHYSANDGLPTQSVYSAIQDRSGFLWIATEAGVSRFDGKKFVNYTTWDGLGDNEILGLYEDQKGRIWFMPFSGKMSYYYKGIFYSDNNDPLLKQLPLRYLYSTPLTEDIEGNIYIPALGERIVKSIKSDNTLATYDLSGLLDTSDEIHKIFRSTDKRHIYCISKCGKMVRLLGPKPELIKPAGFANGHQPVQWHLNCHNYAPLYINRYGLYELDDTTPTLLIDIKDIRFPDIRLSEEHTASIFMDQYRNIWIGYIYHNAMFYRYSNGRYLKAIPVLQDKLISIDFDHEDHIWLSDNHTGLYKLSYRTFLDQSTLSINQSLLQSKILSTCTDKDGSLWLGYSNGYVSQVTGTRVRHYNLNVNARISNRVLQIKPDRKGALWFGTDAALVKLTRADAKGHGTLSWYKSLVKNIFSDTSGALYITQINSIAAIKTTGNTITVTEQHGTDERFFSAFFDSKNRLYISRITGLKYIEHNAIKSLDKEDSRLAVRIQDFAENSHGIIFLASYSNGVIALKDNKVLATLTLNEGLAGIICRRIYLRHDTLYIPTNGGITTAVFEQNKFRVVKNITISDGLISNDVNDLTFWKDTLYAATSEGLSVMKIPVQTTRQTIPPVVNILGFTVNNQLFASDKPIILPYEHQHLRIEFIAPTMDKPQLVQYRYRFGNNTWNITQYNHIEYSDLPHGSYHLEIQAKTYNSNWSASAFIDFTITPPFYDTWWFIAILILLIYIACYMLFRYMFARRFRKTLAEIKEKEAIEKERNRIAADIHDDIGADLTNIVILSQMLKQNRNTTSETVINKLELSSHGVIHKLNEVIWTLNTSNDNMYSMASYLNSYIEKFLETHHLPGHIYIADNVYTDKTVKAELRRNIFLVIKEALHNITKHAEATEVSMKMNMDDGLLSIQIADNGKGFDMNIQQPHTGNGLKNIQKRVTTVKGTVTIDTGTGTGCSIAINIPIE